MREIVVVYRDGRIGRVSVDEVISRLKREGEHIVVEYRDFFDPELLYEYPNLIDVDTKSREFRYTFKRYRGTQRPRLYPKCAVVERGVNYVIVQRYDGVLFKINHAFPGEVLLNIVNNPGIPLWDLISLEVAIMTKEYPDLTEDELIETIEATVEVLGFYAYVLELVEIDFS